MPLVEWTPALAIGVPEIDYQHRNLVGMLNALHDAIEAKEDQAILGEILDELGGYVLTHFAAEERLMERLGYEHQEEHKIEHHRMAEAVDRHREAFMNGESSAQSLLRFLFRWLLNHIAGADSHIADAMRSAEEDSTLGA